MLGKGYFEGLPRACREVAGLCRRAEVGKGLARDRLGMIHWHEVDILQAGFVTSLGRKSLSINRLHTDCRRSHRGGHWFESSSAHYNEAL